MYFDVEPYSADDPVSELQLVLLSKACHLINHLYIMKTTTGWLIDWLTSWWFNFHLTFVMKLKNWLATRIPPKSPKEELGLAEQLKVSLKKENEVCWSRSYVLPETLTHRSELTRVFSYCSQWQLGCRTKQNWLHFSGLNSTHTKDQEHADVGWWEKSQRMSQKSPTLILTSIWPR